MDIHPHIALVCDKRRAGVNPYPHAERPIAQSLRNHRGCLRRVRCPSERQEERVTLGIYLNPAG
jgi:hypothetical protein